MMITAAKTEAERVAQLLELSGRKRLGVSRPDGDRLEVKVGRPIKNKRQLHSARICEPGRATHQRRFHVGRLARHGDRIGEVVKQPLAPRGTEQLVGIADPAS
jgi:hypothetical protein